MSLWWWTNKSGLRMVNNCCSKAQQNGIPSIVHGCTPDVDLQYSDQWPPCVCFIVTLGVFTCDYRNDAVGLVCVCVYKAFIKGPYKRYLYFELTLTSFNRVSSSFYSAPVGVSIVINPSVCVCVCVSVCRRSYLWNH